MKKRKNKRTLKKRIRKIMSLSAFITVIILSGLIISIIIFASEELAAYQAEIVSKEIQTEINSGVANVSLGIGSIEDLSSDNQFTKIWINRVVKNTLLYQIDPYKVKENKIFVKIEINNAVVYTNYDNNSNNLTHLYDNTSSQRIIIDSTHNCEIGTITVKVNPEVIIPMVAAILSIVIIVSIFALIVAKVLSMLLTLPIINPLNQLEKKVKALAQGDHETALHTQLVLKRPLREIESLADSTNEIMNKLHSYTEILEQQNKTLESQYDELEEQNDELVRSKEQIEDQQAKLIQSEKMASVGLLTAAITHEINTPIGAINSNAQISDMLLQELINNQDVKNDELPALFSQLKEANDINLMACSRIIEIIKSLKSFSRLDQAEFQEADINEGIKSILVLTNNLLKNRITIHKDFGDFPPVRCFPGQLNQVFMNIIVNASQAMEGQGELFIRTFQKDEYIFITIRDTGAGIAPENLTKVFDPGYTTKGVGIGLGIGLYLSYNIIQNHNGEISVTSELGKGTEFTIKIPINNDKA